MKNKSAVIRISESEDQFIKKEKLSKAKIFALGLTIFRLLVSGDAKAIKYETKSGDLISLHVE